MLTVLAFIVTIVVIVAFHEWGHFLAMRAFGIRVLTFSVGFGPRIARFTDKKGTDWVISAIPLGGFVKPLDRRDSEMPPDANMDEEFSGKPAWRFWQEPARRETFRDEALGNLMFLLKWLLLAYLIEAVMLRYIPAETIASLLGGDGIWPIFLGAMVGAPAYLNGYAAVPLVDALLAQGMAPGAAMSFVVAGGVSCIPAAIAVWALVKPRVFAAYMGFAVAGSLAVGLAWGALA